MDKKKLEPRAAKLERSLKSERFEELHSGVIVKDRDGNIGTIRARDSISKLRISYGHQLLRNDLRKVNDWCRHVGSHNDVGVVIKYNDGRWDIICGADDLSSLKILDDSRRSSLEESLCTKNEEYDISADLYQWFNQYCCDVIDKDRDGGLDDLKYNLETADIGMFADEASSVLTAEYGWSEEAIEDCRYEIEYDIEKLIKDALDYIECGDTDFTYNINKADWVDRYRDNDTYTASLESRIRKLECKVKNENLDTANDMQLECARNVAFLADKMMRDSADIIEQSENSGDEKLASEVYRMMQHLRSVQFYLNHKLR